MSAVNPDGKLLLQPTVRTTTKSGRGVFYPGGQKPTTRPPPKRQNINIGGFETLSTAERHGVHHNTARVLNDLRKTLRYLIKIMT